MTPRAAVPPGGWPPRRCCRSNWLRPVGTPDPGRNRRLRLKHGALIFLAPGPAQQRPCTGAELWTDPDMTRATLPDSLTRRTGQYVRIRARAEAVYLAFRFGDLAPSGLGQALGRLPTARWPIANKPACRTNGVGAYSTPISGAVAQEQP